MALSKPMQADHRRCDAAFADATEPLLVLMHQHNTKEEHMLYPLCDSTLDGRELVPRLERHLSSGEPSP